MPATTQLLHPNEQVMKVRCDEPEGTVTRSVYLLPYSMETLQSLYKRLSKFEVMFNDAVDGFNDFVDSFLCEVGGEITPLGLIWQVDDVGILYLTDLRPGYEANAHFSFWDQRIRGREKLVAEMTRYVMNTYGFHRIVVEVPVYAKPALKATERIGFKKEGRKRKAIRYKGEWFDVNVYSIVEDELDELQS